MKQIVFLISMHRSGSSLVAKGLESCNVTLGSHLMEGRSDNPKGFFEDTRMAVFNEKILTIMDFQWSLIGTEPTELHENELKDLREEAVSLIKQKVAETEIGLSIGIKDPRFCRLAAFWFSICKDNSLPYKVIFLVRDNNEVSQSLNSRNNIPFKAGYALWLDYLYLITKQLEDTETLFIRLDSFCNDIDSHILSIGEFLGDKVNPDLLKEYSEIFFEKKLFHKVVTTNYIKSRSYDYMTTLQSGHVLTKKNIVILHHICKIEKQTKKSLEGYLEQLNWHRIAENGVLREQITLQKEKLNSLKVELQIFIQNNTKNIAELKKRAI